MTPIAGKLLTGTRGSDELLPSGPFSPRNPVNNFPPNPCRLRVAVQTVSRRPAPAPRRSAPRRRSRACGARSAENRARREEIPSQPPPQPLSLIPLASPSGFYQINGKLNIPPLQAPDGRCLRGNQLFEGLSFERH